MIVAAKIGYRPDSVAVALRAGPVNTITLTLIAQAVSVEAMIVSATRGERRVEDAPRRVEVIDEEEIAEKVTMSPGDIAMMLNETSGLRVQPTNPSLGGANVRIQGLRGRHSQLLADGTAYEEALRSRRADVGALARFVGSDSTLLFGARVLRGAILTVRGSGVEQRHAHQFGDVREDCLARRGRGGGCRRRRHDGRLGRERSRRKRNNYRGGEQQQRTAYRKIL